jgi:hypothetical protein
MSALDNAKAVVENPFSVSHRETIKAMRRLIAEHERVLAERAATQEEPLVVAAALSHIESEDYYIAKPHKAHRDLEAVRQTLLDAAVPQEWEYGVRHSVGDFPRRTLAEALEERGPVLNAQVIRRTRSVPAGPWEPLPEDTTQTEGENR